MAMVLTLGSVAGCHYVSSQHPVGAPVEDTPGNGGVWQIVGEEDSIVAITATGDGRFIMGGLDWDGEVFQVNNIDGIATKEDGVYYLNLDIRDFEDDGEDKPLAYYFVRVLSIDDTTLVLAHPNAEVFAEAVEAGQLEGSVDRSDNQVAVQLTSEPAELNDFIDPDQIHRQFHLDELMILRKLSGDD
ncbi:MAG: hypothetical protein AAGA25_16930 [Planctomycetota bacterium]